MEQRINYRQVAPGAVQAQMGLENYVHQSSLEPSLLVLVKMRASQINGCAHCMEMHSADAMAGGEKAVRLFTLSAWRETPFFSERERAALAWAEAVTLVSTSHVEDEVYEEARHHFSEKELVDLTMAVIAINGWNRLAISLRATVGDYQPARH